MRKIIALLLGSSLIGFVVGYLLTDSTQFNLCELEDYSCRELFNNIGDPLLYGMGALAAVFFLLLIFPRAFNAWKNFALWFLPPVVDIFATYKGTSGGYINLNPDSQQVFNFFAWVYVILSVLIILGSLTWTRTQKKTIPRQLSKRGKIIFWTAWTCYVLIIIGWHFF